MVFQRSTTSLTSQGIEENAVKSSTMEYE